MFKRANLSVFMLSFFALLAVSKNAISGGFMIPHQTARGLALSNAITAGVNDASAIYYNPAALSEVDGNNLLVNGTYIEVISSVENSGRDAGNKHDDNFLGSLFTNYHIPGTDFTVGIGTYAPFGLATTYERQFTRFAAERTELRTLFITPAVSWHPSPMLSVGAGASFVHASGVFSRDLCFNSLGCTFAPGTAEAHLRLTDTANAFTYNVGVLFKPTDTWKFGFSYRGRTDIRFDDADVKLAGVLGNQKVKADVQPLPLPPVINVGAHWQMTPLWGAELVYEYTRWSEFKHLKATFESGPLPGFNLPQNWKNTSTVRVGSHYSLTKDIEVRGGFALEETPIPNSTQNPSIPDADKLTLNVGLGYKWEKLTFDLGYQAVLYKTRRISNNELEGTPATGIPYLGAPGKDEYNTFNNFVTVSVGYKF